MTNTDLHQAFQAIPWCPHTRHETASGQPCPDCHQPALPFPDTSTAADEPVETPKGRET